MPETIEEMLEQLKQQLSSGAISLDEHRKKRDLLWEKRDDPARQQNKFVREGHDEYCTCFTCFRMNY